MSAASSSSAAGSRAGGQSRVYFADLLDSGSSYARWINQQLMVHQIRSSMA